VVHMAVRRRRFLRTERTGDCRKAQDCRRAKKLLTRKMGN
jgi:hypothetical protein